METTNTPATMVWTQKPAAARAHDLEQKAADLKVKHDPIPINIHAELCLKAAVNAIRLQAPKIARFYGLTVTRARLMLMRRVRDQLDMQMEVMAAAALNEGETLASIGRACGYDRTTVKAKFSNITELANRLPQNITDRSRPIKTKDGKNYHVGVWGTPTRKTAKRPVKMLNLETKK